MTRGGSEALPPLIAVVGCDGSGKSTVAAELLVLLREYGRAEMCHLGLQSGDLGRAIGRLPLIGDRIDKAVTARATRARDAKDKIPGAATALIIYAFSLRRLRRFRRMLALRRQGVMVVTDRYPQVAVAGLMDGPGLSAATARGPLVRMLAARERRFYEGMASYRPDLVIRLAVDLRTAIARKPDHRVASLTAKIAAVPRLDFMGAPILDLDSLQPIEDVVGAASQAVRAILEGTHATPAYARAPT